MMGFLARKILVVVDVQKDFVDGALGTPEAQAMIPALLEKVKNFDGQVIFTRDTHPENYLELQEGTLLPVRHCIRETEGWQLIKPLEDIREKNHAVCYDKPTFGSVKLAEDLREAYQEGKLDSVELVGLCTDICVISNALMIKAYMPELPIYVDSACCAGVTPEKHEAALETMKSCQILVDQ